MVIRRLRMSSAVLSSSPRGRGPRLFRCAVRFVLIAFGSLIAALFIGWAAGALYFDLLLPLSCVRSLRWCGPWDRSRSPLSGDCAEEFWSFSVLQASPVG